MTAGHDTALLARLEGLLASAPLGIAFLGPDLRVERVNAALAVVLGCAPESCRGLAIQELVPQLASVLVPVIDQVVATGVAVPELEFSGEAPGAPGTTRHWLSALFPVRVEGGRGVGVGMILRDISTRHRAAYDGRRRGTVDLVRIRPGR